jgi:hypothetical protein
MSTLVSVLVKCGALPPKPPGPAPKSDEATKTERRERRNAAWKRREELIRAAKDNEEQPPTFKRGRPPKYASEEAKRAKAEQNRESMGGHRERIRQGLMNLEAIYASTS